MSADASHFLSPKPTSPLLLQKRRPTTHHRRCQPIAARRITSPEPPWIITPPTAPDNPFEHRIRNVPLNHSTTIPGSIRFIQFMRKKQQHLALTRPPNPANLGSASDAVWSLAFIMDSLQRSTLSPDAETVIARDTAVSVVWLFQRVFSSSPSLASEVLLIGSEFAGEMVKMLEREMVKMLEKPTCWKDIGITEPEVQQRPVRPTCWRDIGIMELEGGERFEGEGGSLDYGRRKMMYEHLIVAEKANSMILSNYAQLLYAYDKDLDRAEHINCFVSAEPVDGEAKRKYSLFL